MLEKNREKWEQEVLRRGEKKGEAKGRTEGRVEERRRVAKRLLTAGMPVSKVAEITDMPEVEVQKLQDSVAN